MLGAFQGFTTPHGGKKTRRWSENATDDQVLALFQSLKEEMGIGKRIDLFVCSCAGSPMIIGFFKPRLFIPTTGIAHEEYDAGTAERQVSSSQSNQNQQHTDQDRVREIGYLFNRTYWHNGYAIEAADAWVNEVFDL